MKNKKRYNNSILLILLFLNLLFLFFYLFIVRKDISSSNKKDIVFENKFLRIYFYVNSVNRAILITTPKKQNILIDMSDKGNIKTITDYLIKKDSLFIKMFFYTTFHEKNISMFDIFSNIIVRKVIQVFSFDDDIRSDSTLNYIKLHSEISYDKIESNKTIFLEPNLKIDFFYPYDITKSENIGTPFILLTYNKLRFLFNYNNSYKDQYFLMQNYNFMNLIKSHKINVVEYPKILDGNSSIFFALFKKMNPDFVVLNNLSSNQENLDVSIFDIVPDFRIKRTKDNLIKIKTDGYNIFFE